MRPSSRPSLLLALCALASACARDDYAHLYQAQPLAPGYTAADISSLLHLGATRTATGVNFAVYLEHAAKLQLLLFGSRSPTIRPGPSR